MYSGLLLTHSLLRYFVLVALVVVIGLALWGLFSKRPYSKWDGILGLYLFIFTHMQLLAGLILYFVSPFVKFGSETMSDKTTRYWSVEHVTAMVVAIALITMARITSKRMSNDVSKHLRMFVFNALALAIIIGTIMISGRKLL